MNCPCGQSNLAPTDVWREEGRTGAEILVMADCPSCRSTRSIPWAAATDAQRRAAHNAEMARSPHIYGEMMGLDATGKR